MRDPLGVRRVLSPAGSLPQAAHRLDPLAPLSDDEVRITVHALNIDAASFRQLIDQCCADPDAIGLAIRAIVADRGKMHNPVTNSGGMLVGQVDTIGADHPAADSLSPGDWVATLGSLTLTPLSLQDIVAVDLETHQVRVRGSAIVPAAMPLHQLAAGAPSTDELRVLDVCGAPSHVSRLAQPGQLVVVLGLGVSGQLCCVAAKEKVGATGLVVGVDRRDAAVRAAIQHGWCDHAITTDIAEPLLASDAILSATEGRQADLVVSATDSPGGEVAPVLICRAEGTVLYFGMNNSFTAIALGAEGAAKDVRLLIGSGYVPNAARDALALAARWGLLRN